MADEGVDGVDAVGLGAPAEIDAAEAVVVGFVC